MDNKIISMISIFLVLFVLTGTSFVSASLDISSTTLLLEEETGNSVDGTITINNNDNQNYDSFTFNYDQTDFSDGSNDISIAFSDPGTIASHGSSTSTISVEIPSDIKLGRYEGTVNITGKNTTLGVSNSTYLTLQIDVRPSDLCRDGRVNTDELRIRKVDEPDSGDRFKPFELIDVDVNVENNDNNDMDVEFRAFLIDKETDDVLEEIKDVAEIKENDDLDFSLSLRVPTDIKERNDRYAVYVMASEDGNEEDHCDWKQVDVRIDKDRDEVIVEKANADTLMCGLVGEVIAKITNVGNNNQNNIYATLNIPDLGISETSPKFDLDEGDDKTVLFSFDIPRDIEGRKYSAVIEVFDENGNLYSRDGEDSRLNFAVDIECTPPKISASLSLTQTSFTVSKGSNLDVVATITNTGDVSKDFIIRVTPIGTWTNSATKTVTLDSGQTITEIFTIPVLEEGSHSAKVEVLADGDIIATQVFSVETKEVIAKPALATTTGRAILSNMLRGETLLLILVIVLAIAVIVLLIWIITLYSSKSAVSTTSKGLNEIKRAVSKRKR